MKYIAIPVTVEAFEILAVEAQWDLLANHHYFDVRTSDGALRRADDKMTARYVPKPGDYWVIQSDGYEYLNPKEVFERKYRANMAVAGLTFGAAIEALKRGERAARHGWNGKGMWLSYSPGSPDLPAEKFWSPHNRAFAESNGGKASVLPCITMKTATGEVLMGWLASQTDMLANDWTIVSE